MAYQIGFDLYESATQQFLQGVQAALRVVAPLPIAVATGESADSASTADGEKKEEGGEKKEERYVSSNNMIINLNQSVEYIN